MSFLILNSYPVSSQSLSIALPLFQPCSPKFKSFSYLYDEDHFIDALSGDVAIVRGLPKDLREARKKIKFPTVSPRNSATPEYYITEVLPRLVKSKVIGVIVNGGNCLQVCSKPMLTLLCLHSIVNANLEPLHTISFAVNSSCELGGISEA